MIEIFFCFQSYLRAIKTVAWLSPKRADPYTVTELKFGGALCFQKNLFFLFSKLAEYDWKMYEQGAIEEQ